MSVVGTSGSGKSRLATQLVSKLCLPYMELDQIRHQPGWRDLPDADFVQNVSQFVEQDGWIVDGNYFSVVTEPVVWPKADAVVWIDLPKATVMRQVIWRTVKRAVLREELWNGNRERVRDIVSWDPYRSIIRWSWTSYGDVRKRYEAAMAETRWNHLHFIRLRTKSEVRQFIDELNPQAAG